MVGIRFGNLSVSGSSGKKRRNIKAVGVRGRKRAKWVDSMYIDLRNELERLHFLIFKLSPSFLAFSGIHII